MITPQYYVTEPVSNPPKKTGWHCTPKGIFCWNGFYWRNANGKVSSPKSWLRPMTQEEIEREVNEFAEWCSKNGWRTTLDDSSIWKRERIFKNPDEKTTSELRYEFRKWKEKSSDSGRRWQLNGGTFTNKLNEQQMNILPIYIPAKRRFSPKLHLAIWNCGARPQSFVQKIKDTRITLRLNHEALVVLKKGAV